MLENQTLQSEYPAMVIEKQSSRDNAMFAVVPLYYLFLGLWQRNYLLAGTAVPFFVIHTINGIMNFAVKR